jgi:hypothetical protein
VAIFLPAPDAPGSKLVLKLRTAIVELPPSWGMCVGRASPGKSERPPIGLADLISARARPGKEPRVLAAADSGAPDRAYRRHHSYGRAHFAGGPSDAGIRCITFGMADVLQVVILATLLMLPLTIVFALTLRTGFTLTLILGGVIGGVFFFMLGEQDPNPMVLFGAVAGVGYAHSIWRLCILPPADTR